MVTPEQSLDDVLATDRRVAEELQDRLRRDRQTVAALRAYLLRSGTGSGSRKGVVRSVARQRD